MGGATDGGDGFCSPHHSDGNGGGGGDDRTHEGSTASSTHHVIDVSPRRFSGGGGGGDEEGRICRVCHADTSSDESSTPDDLILLGCDCKKDLSSAHRECAQTWFRTKGNRQCEICKATATNVEGLPDEYIKVVLQIDEMPEMLRMTNTAASAAQRHHPSVGWMSGFVCLLLTIVWIFRSKHHVQ